MRSARSREVATLETMEKVIAALALSDERDSAIQRLVGAIEDDRELMLARLSGGQAARRPRSGDGSGAGPAVTRMQSAGVSVRRRAGRQP